MGVDVKCKGSGCKVRQSCARFSCKDAGDLQLYFVETPLSDGVCEQFKDRGQENILDQLKELAE